MDAAESVAVLAAAERGAVESLREYMARGGSLSAPVSFSGEDGSRAGAGTGAGAVPAASPGTTPLFAAAASGHATAVRALLQCGARDALAVHVAARLGHSAALEALLEGGCAADGERDELGRAPLHVAAAAGQTTCARQLLRYGARACAREWGGRTPRDLAAAAGHAALSKVLAAAQEAETEAVASFSGGAGGCARCTNDRRRESIGAAFAPIAPLAPLAPFVPPSESSLAPAMLQALPPPRVGSAGCAGNEAAAGSARARLCDWLAHLSMLYALPAFIATGYDDVDFIAAAGLSDRDIDALGVAAPGHRRKLAQLFAIGRFVAPIHVPVLPETLPAAETAALEAAVRSSTAALTPAPALPARAPAAARGSASASARAFPPFHPALSAVPQRRASSSQRARELRCAVSPVSAPGGRRRHGDVGRNDGDDGEDSDDGDDSDQGSDDEYSEMAADNDSDDDSGNETSESSEADDDGNEPEDGGVEAEA